MNAKEILTKAVQCDQSGRILEAQSNYEDGIQILKSLVDGETNIAKKEVFCERIKEYEDRAEQIKKRVLSLVSQGELVEHTPIAEGDTGYSYKSLFGKYLNSNVKEIFIQEPYLMDRHQHQNLIVFFELVVRKCSNLKYISLVTKPDTKNPQNQLNFIQQMKSDLSSRGITLNIKFDSSAHDRKIVLSNGFIIKIGRGLNIFKPMNPYFSLGLCDYEFRKCIQTDVDIWRTKNF